MSPWAFLLCLATSLLWLFGAFPAISSRMQQSIYLTATAVHVNSCLCWGLFVTKIALPSSSSSATISADKEQLQNAAYLALVLRDLDALAITGKAKA